MEKKLTPMQSFTLNLLNDHRDGVSPGYVANQWASSQGRPRPTASQRNFGTTAAAYKTLRMLVASDMAIKKSFETRSGHTFYTFYPKPLRTYAVTGTYHGSIVQARSEGEARRMFHQAWNGESITHVKITSALQ